MSKIETSATASSDSRSGTKPSRRSFLRVLGPGLVWAAAAVGVSHLVQSTRAGATYGFALVGAVLIANLLKYPFFEFGPRYAAATGESLLDGYRRQGRWTVWAYLALTLCSMFAVQGAVTFVTGSLATQIFGDLLSPFGYGLALLVACALILIPGRYPILDRLVKAIIVVLSVSVVAAAVLALQIERPVAEAPSLTDFAGFSFLIALIGWMPSAVDISVWHSLWTLERSRQTGYRPTVKEALLDFNLGYFGTVILALLFLTLGATTWFGRGVEVPAQGGAFAIGLIDMFTTALGPWARWLIIVAAFTTMFSTTLTCLDAFPRALTRATEILRPSRITRMRERTDRIYWLWMAVLVVGSGLLMGAFRSSLTGMVDFATTLSFLTAPVLGWFNFRAVMAPDLPPEARPPVWLRALAWLGLVFGVLFGLTYLVWRFGSWS